MAKKKRAKSITPAPAACSETPVYDQVVVDTGFAPHCQLALDGWRSIPNTVGMLEDNFS
jgi:hypothetical protein